MTPQRRTPVRMVPVGFLPEDHACDVLAVTALRVHEIEASCCRAVNQARPPRFAGVKDATWLVGKIPRRMLRIGHNTRVSPGPCFGCSREEDPQRTVLMVDTETYVLRSPAGPHLRDFSSHTALTRLSPTGPTPPDRNALTWYYALILDSPGYPRTVSTTCAMWAALSERLTTPAATVGGLSPCGRRGCGLQRGGQRRRSVESQAVPGETAVGRLRGHASPALSTPHKTTWRAARTTPVHGSPAHQVSTRRSATKPARSDSRRSSCVPTWKR